MSKLLTYDNNSQIINDDVIECDKTTVDKVVDQYELELYARLNPQQQRFCDHYLKLCADSISPRGNGERAAIAAGYSVKSARTQCQLLLKHEDVRNYIAYKRRLQSQHIEHDINVTLEYKVARLLDIIDSCYQEQVDGTIKLVDSKMLILTIAELNKMQGHYAPAKTISANTTTTIDTEQLGRLIAQYRREY